jgi:outer membrane protein assembly factor BamA
LILLLLQGCLWKLYSQTLEPKTKEEKYVRDIKVVRQDVFPEITGKPRFVYDWANKLHIVTKENVIRSELLFKSGDVFDPELLEESERNLRRLAYIGEVEITPVREESTFVDISVVTQDQWSTLLSTIFRREGGRTTLGLAVEEFNLLGFGKQVFSEFRHEPEGNILSLGYTDPLLFGSRWTTREAFETGPFINRVSAQLVRPFFSLDTKWAMGVSTSFRDEIIRLFEASEEINRVRLETDQVRLFGARALGGRFNKTRLQLTYRFAERDFSAIAGETTDLEDVSDDELIHSLTLGLSFESLSFVEEKQIDKFLRTEDLTLGSITSISLGRTGLPVPKGVKRFELRVRRREAHKIFNKQYLFAILGFVTQFENNRLNDTITSLRLRYYNKMLSRQTLALNFELDYGNALEDTRQFLLGGDSGLRGYPARAFSGVKRFLVNIEDRIFTSLNLFTVAIGGVIFMDAGNVWEEDETLDLTDLNYSVGFGLRLGYTKSPRSRVGRIDFALPLNRGGGFGVSIGVDQLFSVN